jgi:hypothetical protein
MAKANYPDMYEFIRKSPGGASPEDLLEKFYPPGFGRDPFLKDMSNFNKWCKRERGTIAQATNRYVLYDAEVVGPYRRQPKVTSSPAST